MQILLFYKFVNIENPEKTKEEHLEFCNKLGIKGKIILAKEGINGSISGTKEQTNKYKNWLSSQEIFQGIEFKEESSLYHPFNKLEIRIKKEIIRLDKKIDIKNNAKHISPKEFLEISYNENTVILDTRNDYEVNAGKFKNAINPDIKTFREFPQYVDSLKLSKETPIVMYCTGGIRCEKASAYMVQKGFTNVFQLHGGIINFCQQYPNTIWEGECFVFDKRLTSNINQKENPIHPCVVCNKLSDQYRNCKLKVCNKLIFICPNCQKNNHNCCSIRCKNDLLK